MAADLGITASAVRQHLAGLVDLGLVAHRQIKQGPGRPKHRYHLTEVAEALFPKTYSELTNEVLGIVETEDPALLQTVFDRRRDRRVERARARLQERGGGFEDQVDELTRILDEDGYLAEWRCLDDGGYAITEHNCAVLGVASTYGQACSSELEFLRAVLSDATVERTEHLLSGQHRCAYVIRPRPRHHRGTQP